MLLKSVNLSVLRVLFYVSFKKSLMLDKVIERVSGSYK